MASHAVLSYFHAILGQLFSQYQESFQRQLPSLRYCEASPMLDLYFPMWGMLTLLNREKDAC